MDNSQSSDLFSETSGNLHELSTIEIDKYEILVTKIKATACNRVCGENVLLQKHFTVIFDDCRSCIIQCLDIVNSLITEANIQIERLCGYLEDAVAILQILSNFVKTIIESVAITCSSIKNLSSSTGNIILSIFTHCKDSECIYGNSLCLVEKQLKDLFRNCHELQLTYLMVLEKHLIFDLTEKKDQDILVKTLEINLEIGGVVQSLDVKTMAEQWKAYTMICEKYSNLLVEKNIFNNSCELLASMIENNIKITLEANEEDKIVLRSLKVANFSLKILLRICNIFKNSVNNNYEHIVKLLLQITLCSSSYYEIFVKKTSEFSHLMSTYLLVTSEIIIGTLVHEETFLKIIFPKDAGELKGNKLLGYILLVTSVMKALLEKKDVSSDNKHRVIAQVFSFLPYCHKWFNIGLRFKCIPPEGEIQYYGLYEHLLIHSVALSSTLCSEHYNKLENNLYEALLGTEYYTAIFASNLWVLLCRMSNNKVQLDVSVGLIKVYQKLETHSSFALSPQRIHLSYTIEKLFQTLEHEKLDIYKQFSVKYNKNIGVWSALKLQNVHDVPRSMQGIICRNLFEQFNEVCNVEDNLDDLIKYLKFSSTCPLERDLRIEKFLLRAWLKACPVCNNVLQRHLDVKSVWFFNYLGGLASLTRCYLDKFEQRASLIKILNIISDILLIGNIETVHLLFRTFCELTNCILDDQTETTIIVCVLSNTIRHLVEENDVQKYIFSVVVSDDDISKLIIPVLNNSCTKHTWNELTSYKNKRKDFDEWQKELDSASEYKYIHKCTAGFDIDVHDIKKSKSDFDLGDIDSLFDGSDGEEPANKKAKFDVNVEKLIVNLEAVVDQLCQCKEILSEEYEGRIRSVCKRLRNIVS